MRPFQRVFKTKMMETAAPRLVERSANAGIDSTRIVAEVVKTSGLHDLERTSGPDRPRPDPAGDCLTNRGFTVAGAENS